MDPLKTINIPNTETMRSFSLHFQASVAPYEQHLNTLEKKQEPVAANWQGDASEAYGKTNPQLVSIGRKHIEQMQQASHIFDHTANLFDEGKGLQDIAKWQWGMGKAAETALAFPVAASWYILAQKTQEGAQAAVESARAYFNGGFAALLAQISGVPNVSGAHDMTFVPQGVSGPLVEKSHTSPSPHQPEPIEVPPPYSASVEPPPTYEPPPAYHEKAQSGEITIGFGPAQPLDLDKSKSGFSDAPPLAEKGVGAQDPRTFTHFPATNL